MQPVAAPDEPRLADKQPRDPAQRGLYAQAALEQLPRLLAAVDRNPLRPTYGCFDRQFWHYRTADFPSEMYQEAVLPLALAYTTPMPGNRWHAATRVRELAIAGIRFAARSCHRDGACDDYYPQERALGAAVFSLTACTRAYQLLKLHDEELRAFFRRRGQWLSLHDETGRLANHQALAALGLWRVFEITGDGRFADAARARWKKLLTWQSSEGWFDEYGGADPGYHTVTLACLAELRLATDSRQFDGAISRGLEFAKWFLHPDDSYGGDYGSRGAYHFYPHGFELLAAEFPIAARLADSGLRSLVRGTAARFDDDRLVAHRTSSLFSAYADWSPRGATGELPPLWGTRWFDDAKLLVHRWPSGSLVASAARGGVFKFFGPGEQTTDTGLLAQDDRGRCLSTQAHDRTRSIEWQPPVEETSDNSSVAWRLVVSGPMTYARHETATPAKLVLFRLLLLTWGRFARSLVRWLLQRRLITGSRPAPIEHRRTFEWFATSGGEGRLRVTDELSVCLGARPLTRLSQTTDLHTTYLAAGEIYQDSILQPWTDLSQLVPQLNRDGQIRIVREFDAGDCNAAMTDPESFPESTS